MIISHIRLIRPILILLLIFIAGIVFFRSYFIPRPDIETRQNTDRQVAPDISSDNESGEAKEKAADKGPPPQQPPSSSGSPLLSVSPAEPVTGHEIDYGKRRGYSKPGENPEAYIEKGFQRKEGSHFTVKFEGGENSDIGHLISIIMEEAYIKVGSDIGYYPEDRIEAVLYTRQQFADVTMAPSWAGALYDGRIKIPVGGITSRTNLLERVLFHEYAHALVHRLSKGRAPVWLNEGIAQYVEGTANENIEQVLAFVAKSEKPLPLRPFEGSFMGFNTAQAMVAYSISLSATEYIINEFGISAVKRILENLGEGKTMEEAVSSSLYISYEDLQKNWFMAMRRKYAG